VTLLVSIFGIAGRFAGDLLTSALGWASSLLFGRVPRTHQIFVVLMMAFSFLWAVVLLCLPVPSVASLLLSATPHPPFVDYAWLGLALVVAVILLPLAVGLAGYLVPAEGERSPGVSVVREVCRGYLLAPLISGLLVFLAGVGIARKIRSKRHGWSDVHVPVVVKPGGYDQMASDIHDALVDAGVKVTAGDAPWVLTLPATLLTRVAGENVRKLQPERLVALIGQDLRIGVYPSDIAISGAARERVKARAVILGRLPTTSVHLTTSAEAQAIEDRLSKLAKSGLTPGGEATAAFETIDSRLLVLEVPTDEWDILYRLRLQVDRDLLAHAVGSSRPGPDHQRRPGGASQTAVSEAGRSHVSDAPAIAARPEGVTG